MPKDHTGTHTHTPRKTKKHANSSFIICYFNYSKSKFLSRKQTKILEFLQTNPK